MRRVIIVGSDFTPSSYPPALRIRFLAEHLHHFGWEPIILTVYPKYYEWAVDPENEKLLPKSLKVLRTAALPARLTRKFGIGDIGIRSLWHHWRGLTDLCKRQHIDLIFIPVPPYVPMVLGRLIRHQFCIPYVIDYIDPWVSDYYWKLPKTERPPKWALAHAVSQILEPIALRKVSHVVGVSRETVERVTSRYAWLKEVKRSEIPYGGTRADFDFLRRMRRDNKFFDKKDGFLHIAYVGAYVSTMKTTLQALLEAVGVGLRENPGLFSRCRLHFIGTNYSSSRVYSRVLALAREMGLTHIVNEVPGRIPYQIGRASCRERV